MLTSELLKEPDIKSDTEKLAEHIEKLPKDQRKMAVLVAGAFIDGMQAQKPENKNGE